MATYYDPREASTVFSVYAKAYQTQEREREEEEREATAKAERNVGYAFQVPKMLQAYEAGERAETQLLLSQRDPYSDTGMKYDLKPRKKGLKGWLASRKAEDRVVEKAISRPKDATKSEILSDDEELEEGSFNLSIFEIEIKKIDFLIFPLNLEILMIYS